MTKKKAEEQQAKQPEPIAVGDITISTLAWTKMLLARNQARSSAKHGTGNEVAMLGLASTDDPLYIDDIIMVKHYASPGWCEFDDDDMIDVSQRLINGNEGEEGMSSLRFRPYWIHTHPGNSAEPSATDWKTFEEYFGGMDWAVMLILAQDNSMTAHVRINVQVRDNDSGLRPLRPCPVRVTAKVEAPRDLNSLDADDFAYLADNIIGFEEECERCMRGMDEHPERANQKAATYRVGFRGDTGAIETFYGKAKKLDRFGPLPLEQVQAGLERQEKAMSRLKDADLVRWWLTSLQEDEIMRWKTLFEAIERELSLPEIKQFIRPRYRGLMNDNQAVWLGNRAWRDQLVRLEKYEEEYRKGLRGVNTVLNGAEIIS